MVLAIVFTSMPVATVYAESTLETVVGDVAGQAIGQAEATKDAIIDSLSQSDARLNDWGTAIFKDYFWWNSFHNMVQRDIIEKNDEMRKEVYIKKLL